MEREAYRAVYRDNVPSRGCEQCGKTFAPQREKADTRYRSLRYFTDSRKVDIEVRPCQQCGETSIANRVDAQYCSKACNRFAYRVATNRITRVSPPVLDFMLRQQGIRVTMEVAA
ncbi:hypothetical protein C5748_27315 [Phyllobacterium phragmitis]|uniref:Uncharacterized protein n=1 Tax=Phyllobacterium phragmitis TaxID=2670329 RepID=A0A2S9IIM5_9HYPH|nr:hypothetical protein [Phyllobacterium phragmitis]PRD40383.1 hypothetical protein C5748_27315 [Phyllobacterium phragmitis]